MPIENSEEAIAPIEKGIESNITVLAGLAVRHALIPYRFIIEGFVIEDEYFNATDFLVNQMNIEYQIGPDEFTAINTKVYPKMIFDGKKEKLTDYISNTTFEHRYKTNYDKYEFANYSREYHQFNDKNKFLGKVLTYILNEMRFNYYLFDTTVSETAICVANKVFVLCKYWEDGKFKYMIFNMHEIKPDV